MSPDRAERRALDILRSEGFTRPAVDVEQLVLRRGIRLERRVLEDGVSGCLVRRAVGAPVLLVNGSHPVARQRFTMAHELGHFELHETGGPGLFVDESVVHFRATGVGSSDEEREANAFAAMLLMPRHMLEADLSAPVDAFDEAALASLASRYGVSVQALTIQLVRLGLLVGWGDGGSPSRADRR